MWQNYENALQNAVRRKLCVLFGKLQVKPCELLQQNTHSGGKIAKNTFIAYYSIAKRAQFCTTCAPFANVCLQTASQQRLDKNKLCKISICQTQNSKAHCTVKRNRNKRAQIPPRGHNTTNAKVLLPWHVYFPMVLLKAFAQSWQNHNHGVGKRKSHPKLDALLFCLRCHKTGNTCCKN